MHCTVHNERDNRTYALGIFSLAYGNHYSITARQLDTRVMLRTICRGDNGRESETMVSIYNAMIVTTVTSSIRKRRSLSRDLGYPLVDVGILFTIPSTECEAQIYNHFLCFCTKKHFNLLK